MEINKIEAIIDNIVKTIPGIIDIYSKDKNVNEGLIPININERNEVSIHLGIIVLTNSYVKTIVEELQQRLIYELNKNGYKLYKLEVFIKGTRNE